MKSIRTGKDIICSGPFHKAVKKEGGKMRLPFDPVGAGLMVAQKRGLDPAQESPAADLTSFTTD